MKKAFVFASLMLLFTVLFAQSRRALVTGISAIPLTEYKISVSWNLPVLPEEIRLISLALYRDTRPIENYTQTQRLARIATLSGEATSFTDNVLTSQEFYYAVVSIVSPDKKDVPKGLYYDEESDVPDYALNASPVSLVLPGVNATLNGVKVALQNSASDRIEQAERKPKVYNDTLREQPLPYLKFADEQPQRKGEISEIAQERAEALGVKRSRSSKPLQPHVFEDDFITPSGGDAYLLYDILRTTFINGRYDEAARSLEKFLSQNRTQSVHDRSMFYLGESYYFTGHFPQALENFLKIEDVYPTLCRKWIESTLDMYELK